VEDDGITNAAERCNTNAAERCNTNAAELIFLYDDRAIRIFSVILRGRNDN